MGILSFLIALGLLIFVHELGHFLLAKRAGIYVEVFSLGFGPRLAGFTRGNTDYRLSLLPLGGYVKMRGEDPDDEQANAPDSFAQKSVWQRAQVIACGPLMNVVLAFVLMPIVFMIGHERPAFLDQPPVVLAIAPDSPAERAGLQPGDRLLAIDGVAIPTWEKGLNTFLLSSGKSLNLTLARGNHELKQLLQVEERSNGKGGYTGIEPTLFLGNAPIIDHVNPGSPAEEAGLMASDRVIAVNGKVVANWTELAEAIHQSKGESVAMKIVRQEHELQSIVTPHFDAELKRWVIGIRKDVQSGIPMTIKKFSFLPAIGEGIRENMRLLGMMVDMLKRLFTFHLNLKAIGGPIMIAQSSAAAAAAGLADFLYFLAFLSLNLATLNCLPIPVLDGGHLAFLGLEALFRRPINFRIRQLATQVGFVLLMALMLTVTFNDIRNSWNLGAWVKKIF